MAAAEAASPSPPPGADRPHGRRRPFSAFMKKLANFKGGGSSSSAGPSGHGRRVTVKHHSLRVSGGAKRPSRNNNPYPQSGRIGNGASAQHHSSCSLSTGQTGRPSASTTSFDRSESLRSSAGSRPPAMAGARSAAPTMSTDHEATRSITGRSFAGTTRTAYGGVESRRGGDSTFSSPAPSVRSLTTTLTTIQSLAVTGSAGQGAGSAVGGPSNGQNGSQQNQNWQSVQFNQPFPTASPASAIPAHLTPSGSLLGHPMTYNTATANNLLSDNASILTLASSSKGRRRRSLDTDASVRALAPSSLFGGSRESLPLSVLSANIDGATGPPTAPGTAGAASSRMVGERASIYSATGILTSERNSLYAKQGIGSGVAVAGGGAGDGASVRSVRSGFLGHGRADSVSGSITGLSSPLVSPREEREKEEEKEREKESEVLEEAEKEMGKDAEKDEEKGRTGAELAKDETAPAVAAAAGED